MSFSFTKLCSSITDSSVWSESSDTKVVWITLLAMADSRGRVMAAVPGLARRAVVSIEATELALRTFLAPDPYSRSRNDDGRRIREIDRGWEIINYGLFREMRDEASERERKRLWMEAHRAASTKVHGRPQTSTASTVVHDGPQTSTPSTVDGSGRELPQAEAEAEAEAEKREYTHLPSVLRAHAGEKSPGAETCALEPPAGFPRTEAEAEQTADTLGCPRAFASKTWTRAAARGWRDAKDVPIRHWSHYLKSCFTYAEERDAKDKARANERPFDRNGRTAVRSKSSFQENLDQADAFIAQEKARDAADRIRDGKERAART